MEETGMTLADYSVALGYAKNGEIKKFKPIGSGVLVRKGNRYGLLTAHHCIHSPGPELHLGWFGGDALTLVIRRGRSVIVQSQDVNEIPLATPTSIEFGPDLAFLEFLSKPLIGSIKAISSFWPLDKNPDEIKKGFGKKGTLFAVIGFPGVHQDTKREGLTIRHIIKHMAYYFVIKPGNTFERDGWDYIEGDCEYFNQRDALGQLPDTFAGVSGGPVWGLQLHRDKPDGKITLADHALIGIAFLQTPIKRKRRQLRAHFIRSIYETAWSKMK